MRKKHGPRLGVPKETEPNSQVRDQKGVGKETGGRTRWEVVPVESKRVVHWGPTRLLKYFDLEREKNWNIGERH